MSKRRKRVTKRADFCPWPPRDIKEWLWSDIEKWSDMQKLTLKVVVEELNRCQPKRMNVEEEWSDIEEKAILRIALEKMKLIMAIYWPLAFKKEVAIEELQYQMDVNNVEPIPVTAGKLPRPEFKKLGTSEKYLSNPLRTRNALWNANFKCEINSDYTTFINKRSQKQYMEPHHLIPMNKQWAFEFDIDVFENILCLCPTCHRKIHLAEDDQKREILLQAFNIRKDALPKRGISIDFEALCTFYLL
jgi:predicted HNH restriction endonuclease